MDDAVPQSLFVVVSYVYHAPYFSSIILLEENQNNLILLEENQNNRQELTSVGCPKLKRSSSSPSLSLDTHPNQKQYEAHLTSEGLPKIPKIRTYSLDLQKDYVAHLTQPVLHPPVYIWTFCTPAISAEYLCMVPDRGCRGCTHDPIDVPLKGFILNLSTKNCKSIKPPDPCICYKLVVALGGHIYCLIDPCSTRREAYFTRYNPLKDEWETREPFPDYRIIRGRLLATAVLDDTIVLNIDHKFWAYDVIRDKWYRVRVDGESYSILGEAVVLENTIYALTEMSRDSILALSIEKKEINDDLEFSCPPPFKIHVAGMEENKIMGKDSIWLTRHLVHLGEDNFCLVQSCQSDRTIHCQPIQVTYIKLKKGEMPTMTVTGTVIHKLKIPQEHQFRVRLCFSLPDHKTDVLKQGKGSVLKCNPFPEDYASEQNDKNQEAEVPEVTPPPDENFPPRNANVIQVEKELEKFGTIKRDGIQASPIIIGGSSAQILEKKTSKKKKTKKRDQPGLTLGISVRSGQVVSRLRIKRASLNKKVEAVSKLGSSSSSIMDDAVPQSVPQSLFVVVSYGYRAPYFSSIFLLERNPNNEIKANRRPKIKKSFSFPSLDTHLNLKEYEAHLTSKRLLELPKIPKIIKTYYLDLQKDYVLHLTRPRVVPPLNKYKWTFCTPVISAEDLCILPDRGSISHPIDVPLKGFILNLRTKNCKPIQPPECCRYFKHVVALGGHIYCLTDPYFGAFFTRYNPLKDKWENLERFPDYDDGPGILGPILASAVLDDTIVLNIDCRLWAYDVKRNKWYLVDVGSEKFRSKLGSILGKAVVLGNTIYALTEMSDGLVLGLSFRKKEIGGDLVCSSLYELPVTGMDENEIMDENSFWLSRHLVHLGEDNFCLVQSCYSDCFIDCQPIQVTYIKLKKGKFKKMWMTGTVIHKLSIPQYRQFYVELCFSLPDHKTDVLKQGGGSILEVNPFPPRNADVVNNNVNGHSIYVRNLPRNANVIQVEKELEKFGAIKKDGIQVLKYRTGSYAFVEFERADSKQRAIEASPIIIGGCSAQILEKRASQKRKNKRKEMNRGASHCR